VVAGGATVVVASGTAGTVAFAGRVGVVRNVVLSVPAVVPLVMSTVFDPIGVSPKRTVTVHTPGDPIGIPCSIGRTATPAVVSGTLRMTPGTVVRAG